MHLSKREFFWLLLPFMAPALAGPVVCDATPKVVEVLFAPQAVALTDAQRNLMAMAWGAASGLQMNYTLVEPRAARAEGNDKARKDLARRRGDYVKAFLVTAGVESRKVEISMTGALTQMGPEEHPGNRMTSVAFFVIDENATRRCLDGK